MLNVVVPNVIMINVVMLSVVAPMPSALTTLLPLPSFKDIKNIFNFRRFELKRVDHFDRKVERVDNFDRKDVRAKDRNL